MENGTHWTKLANALVRYLTLFSNLRVHGETWYYTKLLANWEFHSSFIDWRTGKFVFFCVAALKLFLVVIILFFQLVMLVFLNLSFTATCKIPIQNTTDQAVDPSNS